MTNNDKAASLIQYKGYDCRGYGLRRPIDRMRWCGSTSCHDHHGPPVMTEPRNYLAALGRLADVGKFDDALRAALIETVITHDTTKIVRALVAIAEEPAP